MRKLVAQILDRDCRIDFSTLGKQRDQFTCSLTLRTRCQKRFERRTEALDIH